MIFRVTNLTMILILGSGAVLKVFPQGPAPTVAYLPAAEVKVSTLPPATEIFTNRHPVEVSVLPDPPITPTMTAFTWPVREGQTETIEITGFLSLSIIPYPIARPDFPEQQRAVRPRARVDLRASDYNLAMTE